MSFRANERVALARPEVDLRGNEHAGHQPNSLRADERRASRAISRYRSGAEVRVAGTDAESDVGDRHGHYRANEQGQVQPTPRDPGARK